MPRTVAVLVLGASLLLGASPAAPPDYPVRFMTVETLKQLTDQKVKVRVYDVRTLTGFASRRIKGARSRPLRVGRDRASEVPKLVQVVFY